MSNRVNQADSVASVSNVGQPAKPVPINKYSIYEIKSAIDNAILEVKLI